MTATKQMLKYYLKPTIKKAVKEGLLKKIFESVLKEVWKGKNKQTPPPNSFYKLL